MNCEKECFLVMAPWGQPVCWSNVTYAVDNIKLESCSPLPVLLLHIAEKSSSSIKRIYLMGLDSVVDVPDDPCQHVKSICKKAFLECRKRLKSSINCSSYTELAKHAEELYKCILEKILSNAAREAGCSVLLDLIDSITTVVLPATGSPGGRIVFRGNPEDYLSIALLTIGRDLLFSRDLFENCSSIVLVLDITHGINYTAALAMRIAEITAEILKLLYNKPVKLEVYNSDPVVPGRGSSETRINKVYEKKITEIEIPLLDELKLFNPALIEEPCLNTVEKHNTEWRESNAKSAVTNVVASLYTPAPLALLYACLDYRNSLSAFTGGVREDVFSKIAKTWLNTTFIKDDTVQRCLSVPGSTAWSTLVAEAVCRRVESLMKVVGKAKIDFGDVPAFKLDLLKEVAENIYSRVHSTAEYIVKDEVSKLKKYVKDAEEKLGEHGVDSCVSYGELIERVKGTPASEKPTQTTTPQGKERHFIAHAGMLKDVVQVCEHNGELYVKYASVKEVENAYERSKNVLRRRGK